MASDARTQGVGTGDRAPLLSNGTQNAGGNFPRSDSITSVASSRIVADAEEIRQRHKKVYPKLKPGEEGSSSADKDYRTMVHTFSLEKLAALFKTKMSDNYACDKSAAGLKESQVEHYLTAFGKNEITPPQRENKWIKLIKMTFTGIFNILLWGCVIAEVMLIIANDMQSVSAKGADADEESLEEKKESDYVTPCLLSFVIVSAALLQWWTEMQAESMMEALQQMQSKDKVRGVRRSANGQRVDASIDPSELVPGDIIYLEAGMRIPADIRILKCTDGMEVDNSALTGESVPEPRKTDTEKPSVPPAESKNLAFFGTTVLKGNATVMVHETGDNTFLGKIAQGIKSSRTHSTLEIQIEHFVHVIAVVAICVGALSLIANITSPIKRCAADMLENSSSALFAQVPEGLLPTVTISLMIASKKMSERHVLVVKLDSVETLGCVSVICSDKTGTLTTGEMATTDLVLPITSGGAFKCEVVNRKMDGSFETSKEGEGPAQDLCQCGILCNGALLVGSAELPDHRRPSVAGGTREWTEKWQATGSPTEVAILHASTIICGGPAHTQKIKLTNRQVFEIPFNSENKWMVTIHTDSKDDKAVNIIMKGAPERVLDLCKLTDAERSKVEAELNKLMANGRRVLCMAKQLMTGNLPAKFQGTSKSDVNFPLKDFQFIGLFGIEDPPKTGVADAVVAAQDAGVKVVMVTGDHPDTARAIAGRICILDHEQLDLEDQSDARTYSVIPGKDLEDKLPKGEAFTEDDNEEIKRFWMKAVTHARVFARVSPIHKQVIVQAFQYFGANKIGDIVAMTGDGVNDAPALKQAEVGVAMGIRGTEVAKDAADIVLLDDNFSSIVAGMEQGRLSSDNLQKSIMYTLCSKVPQVAPTFAELFGIPQALTVAQVLLIDIGTDIWTAIAYAVQPAESRLMQRPPRHPRLEKMVNWKVLVYSYGYIGQLQMLCCWVMFFLVSPGILELMHSGKTANDYTAEDKITDKQGMTVYYWTLVLGQIAAAISTTTKVQSVVCGYGLPNHTLNIMFVFEFILGIGAIYWSTMQGWFNTAAIPIPVLCSCIGAFVFICAVEEIRKAVARGMEDTSVKNAPRANE